MVTVTHEMSRCWRAAALCWWATICVAAAASHSPAPTYQDINNPHKGFMLWGTSAYAWMPNNHYSATIYHVYVPWREIETSDQVFDWDSFETRRLAPILAANTNATFVLRPVADYPGTHAAITNFYIGGEPDRDFPRFLIEPPLSIAYTAYEECDGDGPGWTPDWNDPTMHTQLVEFVEAFAERYDGDPRITAVQVGLLGLWGEWHQSGCSHAGPSNTVKEIVRDAYAHYFTNTPLQTRYPRDPDAVGVTFGFYEDYFPSFTAPCVYDFPFCSDAGDWSLHYCYVHVTPSSSNNWLYNPISGESPRVEQKQTWSNEFFHSVMTVLEDYHFSFLGPAGGHEWDGNQEQLKKMKRLLGYNYHIERVDWPDTIYTGASFPVTLAMTNSGAAPCYHDFKVELALCAPDGTPQWREVFAFDLRALIPGAAFERTEYFNAPDLPLDEYSLRIGILDPRTGEPGIRIQSEGEDANHRIEIGPVLLDVLDPAGPMSGITATNSFIAYYGNDFSQTNLEALAQFDVVVLHLGRTNCTPAAVAYLQNAGVQYVIGYISIGEEHGYLPWVTGDGAGPVYYDDDGNIVTNTTGVVNDNATNLVINGDLSDWAANAYVSFGDDPADDADPGDVNWVRAYWAHDTTHYYLAYQTHENVDFNDNAHHYMVFLDTDRNPDTGYRGGGGNFSIGADYMIQGATVFRYTGDGGSDWGWTSEGLADFAVSGKTVEMTFPKSWVGAPTDDAFHLIFFSDDDSGDVYPDHALDGGYFTYPMVVASYYVDQAYSNSEGDYIRDGRPDTNWEWGSRFVWPNEVWRDVLYRQRIGGVTGDPDLRLRDEAGLAQIVGERVSDDDTDRTNNFGFDGFFLDTIDTAGPFAVERSYPWAAEEMQKTVRFIRESFPEHIVFANRGFFYSNPNQVDGKWGIRSYDYTIRPYIHAALFESYVLDSNHGNPGTSPWFDDNKYNWAPKINAEANRPDGFTMFCLDYENNRGSDLYDLAIQEAAVSNGWIMYLAPDHSIDRIGTYVLTNPPPPDTSAPVWNSTAGLGDGIPPPARVGLQAVRLGPRYDMVTLHWDVAHDQTGPIRYDILRATHEDFSGTVTVYSNVHYEVGEGWEEYTVTAYANQFALPLSELEPGTNYFRVRARDSSTPEGRAEDNTVTLSFAVPEAVSNPDATIEVDGDLADWDGLTFFPSDPADIEEPETIDWRELAMAHDRNRFYVAFSNHYDEFEIWHVAIYLDTDSNRDTGFRGGGGNFPIGADYLLLGNNLYGYTGSGTDWSWDNVLGTVGGGAGWQISGHTAECSFPRAWLQDSKGNDPETIRLFAYGANDPHPVDYMPDDALSGGHFLYVAPDPSGPFRVTNPNCHIVVDGDFSDWTGLTLFPSDPADAGVPETIDWRELAMAHDEDDFYIAFSNEYAIGSVDDKLKIFFDTDLDRTTGFRGLGDDYPLGADYAVVGNALLAYTGDGTSWEWDNLIGAVDWVVDGHTAECSFPRAWLGVDRLDAEMRLFAFGDNWQVEGAFSDYMPDDALTGDHFRYFFPDPWTHDTDGDGLPDGWKYLHFDCYTNANPHAYGVCGVRTLREHYISGTDPNDENSLFSLEREWTFSEEELTFLMDTVTNRIYWIERTLSLDDIRWEGVVSEFPGTGRQEQITVPNVLPRAYYRGRVRLPANDE